VTTVAARNTTRLLCVYEDGAAGPMEIVRSLGPIGHLAVLLEEGSLLTPLFTSFGVEVVSTAEEAVAFRPEGVVTYSEAAVLRTADLCAELGLPGLGRTAARALRDKAAQRGMLSHVDAIGFRRCHGTQELDAAIRDLGFPVVVKPADGWGSKGTVAVRTIAERDAVLLGQLRRGPLLGDVVVERELVGRKDMGGHGDYVSVETLVQRGEVTPLVITGKLPLLPPFREPGQYLPAAIPDALARAIERLVVDACRALEIADGVLHVEVKLCEDGPHLIELNGRLGGFVQALVWEHYGVDMIQLAAQVALGQDVRAHVAEFLRRPEKVTFQHFNQAPLDGGRLVAVTGHDRVRRLDGVSIYRSLEAVGARLSPTVATHDLDFIQGSRRDYAGAFDLLNHALESVQFVFEIDGHHVPLSGAELLRRNRDNRSTSARGPHGPAWTLTTEG
jgi:hypothetical protein